VKPATRPRPAALEARLLRVDPVSWAIRDVALERLAAQFRPGDLLVLNDAATLPASLAARAEDGATLEVRLAGPAGGNNTWTAVLFGEGTWRTRTEHRAAPRPLARGAALAFGDDLGARVSAVSTLSPRLVQLTFDRDDEALWSALYRHGRPVQYSHLAEDLDLWDVQTSFAGRPWSVETPSAARPLNTAALAGLRAHGVAIASVTHAAGLSATGDVAIDRALPLPERSEVPADTVEAVAAARERGERVIAAGTSTVRALEANALAHGGALRAACGMAGLRIGSGFVPRIVQGLLTGMHEAGTSHFELLTAFAPRTLLGLALSHARDHGYVGEEFGDAMLLLNY